MSQSRQSYRIGILPSLRQRFSQDDWTLCSLMVVYYFGLFVFACALLLLGGCSAKNGFDTDVGLKTTVTHAPRLPTVPPTSTLRKSDPTVPVDTGESGTN